MTSSHFLPVLLLSLYTAGIGRLWRRNGWGSGISGTRVVAFCAGMGLFWLAFASPLSTYAASSLAASMTQHMLLLAFVPPLVIAGRPLSIAMHILPQRFRSFLRVRTSVVRTSLAASLFSATALHGLVMGIWHLPSAITAALSHGGLHIAMHLSFLLAGFWFWGALVQNIRARSTSLVGVLTAVVVAMMQMGLIGALLTFSRRTLYPVYAERGPLLNIDPLLDQQLAGIIMWVPACVPYLIGGVWLLKTALQRPALSKRETPPSPKKFKVLRPRVERLG